MGGRVLIVDDDDGFRRTLARVLERRGYDVITCASASEARSVVPNEPTEIIVLDYQLPDADGLQLLEELRPHASGSVFLMATAFPDLDVAVEAMRRGAFDYVAKGGELEECLMRVERASEVAALRRRAAEASTSPEAEQGLLGDSPPMRELRSRLSALASSDDTTVLITGETGTGKGVVARWVHNHSGRSFQPFVAVDCTTIPETLVESELFGHEKGSFSGASALKIGRVEAASRGTLFLDEIGELQLPIQAKLLRLLEEREYTRVGSTRTRHVDARIITATNRDLATAVANGTFRSDLRYRLEVFVVETPPLRERGEDIMVLTGHFIAKHARALGRNAPVLTPEVVTALKAYPFPGNVRELRNMVEQAVLLCGGERLTMGDFPVLNRHFRQQKVGAVPVVPTQSSIPPRPTARADVRSERPTAPRPTTQSGSLQDIRRRAEEEERSRIVQALEEAGGNVSAAARSLNMSRYQMLRRIQKYGLR